ncbi:MAG: redoxin domain-containing protein [Candidatus Hydrogenedentes bacterium]|nr:redoxin domain-containing protein [Candidatus Hydrogenedentota bacterium]
MSDRSPLKIVMPLIVVFAFVMCLSLPLWAQNEAEEGEKAAEITATDEAKEENTNGVLSPENAERLKKALANIRPIANDEERAESAAATTENDATKEGLAIGDKAPKFKMTDQNGVEHTLAQYEGKAFAIVTWSDKCPVSNAKDPDMNELYNKFKVNDIAILGMDSHKDTTPEEIKAFASEKELEFPILKDEQSRYARKLGAERTPEVFVFNKNHELAYHGGIDNQKKKGDEGYEPFAANALDSIASGAEVKTAETASYGCGIKWHPGDEAK